VPCYAHNSLALFDCMLQVAATQPVHTEAHTFAVTKTHT
jgi:hypothetical protein